MSPTKNKIAVGVLLALGVIDVGILNMVLVPAVLEEENQALVADTTPIGVDEHTIEPPSEPIALEEVAPRELAQVVDQVVSENGAASGDVPEPVVPEPVVPSDGAASGQEKTIQAPALESSASAEPVLKIEQHILFSMGSDRLTEGAVKQLVPIARRARKLKLALHLSGHTDASGEPRFNTLLSRRRVQAVRDKLRQLGISKKDLRLEHFGDRRPIPDREDTMQRRVEIRLWRTEQ